LSTSDDSDALDVLARADREGRLPGRHVCSAEEAIDIILELETGNDGPDAGAEAPATDV
jgi:hypothetical protein